MRSVRIYESLLKRKIWFSGIEVGARDKDKWFVRIWTTERLMKFGKGELRSDEQALIEKIKDAEYLDKKDKDTKWLGGDLWDLTRVYSRNCVGMWIK